MKKIFLYIFLGFLITSNANAFGNVTFVCEWDGYSDKELFEIKNKKVYIDGELWRGKTIKLSYFLNKLEWINTYDSYMSVEDQKLGKVTSKYKINFSTNIAYEIRTQEGGFYKSGLPSLGNLVLDESPHTVHGKCYKT